MDTRITNLWKQPNSKRLSNSRREENVGKGRRKTQAVLSNAFRGKPNLFAMTLLVCFFANVSGFKAAAQTLNCKTGCTSNDVQIRSAYLMQDRNGTSLQSCASGTPVQAYLYLDLVTNTPRVGVSITANLYNKNSQTLVQAVGECFGQALSSSGTSITTVIFASPINWTCGTQIELKDVLIGWGTGGSNFCVGSAAQCPGTSSKCWKQGATTYIPVVTFPCSSPSISSQPASQNKCEGQSATFTTVFTEGDPDQASIQWKISADNGGTWNNVPGFGYSTSASTVTVGLIKETTASLSVTSAAALQNGYKFKAVLTNNTSTHNCGTESNAATLTVSQLPTIASAGSNQNICGSLTSNGLGGNVPATGTGTWTKKSGPGTVSFSSVNGGNSSATVSSPGTYVFNWTISNGACTATSAEVTVNFYATPTTATVGSAQNICGSLTSGNLGGNTPLAGTGTWSKKSGPGSVTFSNAGSGSATATVNAYGNYVFTWTVANGSCSDSKADIAVNYYATPSDATVGGNQNMCGSLTSGNLGGNSPAIGTGAWSKKSGPGNVTFSNNSSGASTATVDALGSYVFTWTITNGTCAAKTADVAITYYATPTTATVGNSQIRCATLVSENLGGNSPVVGTGSWSKKSGPGTVSFSNNSAGNATATVSVSGSYVFTWTISNGTCTTSSADISVSYYAKPPLNAEITTEPTCAGLGTISVTSPTNGLSFSINSTTNYSATSVFTGLTPGTYTIRAKNNTSGCISDYVELTLQPIAGAPDKPKVEIIDYATPESETGTLMVVNSITELPYGTGFEFRNDGFDATSWTSDPTFIFTAGKGYEILVRRTSDHTCIASTVCPNGTPANTSRMAAPATKTPQPIGRMEVTGMSAFPIPFHDGVTLEFTSDKDESYVINLYDARGNLVKELKAGMARAGEINRIEVNGRGMTENLYLARKVSKSGVSTVKLLKEK